MTTPKLLSAEELARAIKNTPYAWRPAELIENYARAVLEAAAEEAPERCEHCGTPSYAARAIRKLKEGEQHGP